MDFVHHAEVVLITFYIQIRNKSPTNKNFGDVFGENGDHVLILSDPLFFTGYTGKAPSRRIRIPIHPPPQIGKLPHHTWRIPPSRSVWAQGLGIPWKRTTTLAWRVTWRRKKTPEDGPKIKGGNLDGVCSTPTWNPKQPFINGCLVKQPFSM